MYAIKVNSLWLQIARTQVMPFRPYNDATRMWLRFTPRDEPEGDWLNREEYVQRTLKATAVTHGTRWWMILQMLCIRVVSIQPWIMMRPNGMRQCLGLPLLQLYH